MEKKNFNEDKNELLSFGELLLNNLSPFYDRITETFNEEKPKRVVVDEEFSNLELKFCVATRILVFLLKNSLETKERLLSLKIEAKNDQNVLLPRMFVDILLRDISNKVNQCVSTLLCFWFAECPKVIRIVFRAPQKYFPKIISCLITESFIFY